MEKSDPEGPRAIEEKLRRLVPITLSRLRPRPVDGSFLTNCSCGATFGMMVRQHHCRSCGQVFCWQCAEKRTLVPEALVEYHYREGWWKKDTSSRVCKMCMERILKYEECGSILEQFYARPHPLEKLFSIEQQNEISRRAVAHYLSEMKRIQYLFPSENLSVSQADFIRTNRVILSTNPHAWLMQILKVESVASQKKLLVHNAMDMIIFSSVYRNSIEIALQALAGSNPNELIPYLPVMAGISDLRLHDVLVDKSQESPAMAFTFYWALNVLSGSLTKGEAAVSHREHLLVKIGDIGEILINFRRFMGAIQGVKPMDKGLTAMRSSIANHRTPDPLDLERTMSSIDKVEIGDSHSTPVFVTYTTRDLRKYEAEAFSSPELTLDHLQRGDVQRKIMFKHEDTRKDACIIKIIRMLVNNLVHIQNPFPLISYSVIPIDYKSGLVEIVEKSQTLFSISSSGSINNYLQQHNAERTMGDVQKTYTLSLAFWTIITYVFGVGDRHFDNIMLSSDGILFHIDYGFIFGVNPKPYSPLIRLNSYMIEGIGGKTKYGEFKELCYQIFDSLKKNMDQIYTFLLELVLADPKIEGIDVTEHFIRDHLSRVFFVGDTEEGMRSKLEFIIDSSKDSWGASIGDYIHSTAKTTTRMFGRLTGMSSSPT